MFGMPEKDIRRLTTGPALQHTALWLCNPNNPTGETLSRSEVLHIASTFGLLILDQSYEDYTAVPLLSPFEAIGSQRIIQIFSMTKSYAVPGLRIGYLIAPEAMAAQLRGCMRPWAVNALAIEAGKWLIGHGEKAIPDKALMSVPGIDVRPTTTNFMLCRTADGTAAALKRQLAQQHHILIRDAANFEGLDAHHFRVAAQTHEENDLLVKALIELTG